VGQFPGTCGVTRLRPPCSDGSSCVLVRTVDEYRSRNDWGRGGRLEEGALESLRFFAGGLVSVHACALSFSSSTSESE